MVVATMDAAAVSAAVAAPVFFAPILRPLDSRRRYLDARSKMQIGQRRRGFLHSQQLSLSITVCAAAQGATSCVGQTQTVQRQSKPSIISPLGPGIQKTPKLEKGGDGGPPHDGGGGGGGGGGGSSSGGFFLFAFLLFLRFVKEKEKEMECHKEERTMISDLDDY